MNLARFAANRVKLANCETAREKYVKSDLKNNNISIISIV
jgi:hypothetical protein